MSQNTLLTTDDDPVMPTQDNNLLSPNVTTTQSEPTDDDPVMVTQVATTQPEPTQVRDIMDPANQHPKIKEKRKFSVTHFNYYLNVKNAGLVANSLPVTVRTFDDLTYDDIDTGDYMAEYANYLSKHARKWCKPTQDLISYASAAGYMGAVKNLLVDKYRSSKTTPKQITGDTWKRFLTKIHSTMRERCRRENKPLHGSKQSATDEDRYGIYAICIWEAKLQNAEFLNFFQSMVMNCGRGCEIGLTRYEHLKMKKIHEPNGINYHTLEQYINRTKVLSK